MVQGEGKEGADEKEKPGPRRSSLAIAESSVLISSLRIFKLYF